MRQDTARIMTNYDLWPTRCRSCRMEWALRITRLMQSTTRQTASTQVGRSGFRHESRGMFVAAATEVGSNTGHVLAIGIGPQ